MSEWLYTIRERCNAETLEGWDEYLTFSGFTHITELVTLDSMMCPAIIIDLVDEDWNHNVHEDCRITFFRDAEYLLNRQVYQPTQPAGRRTVSGTWRAIADAASGITFIGVLGWGMWHLGSQLLQLAPQVAAAWERYPL